MLLIDANIFMYAAGAEHPRKAPSVDCLRRIALGEIAAAVDAEVLREILHRYRAIRRWHEGREVYALASRIVPLVVAWIGRATCWTITRAAAYAMRCTPPWCRTTLWRASAAMIGIWTGSSGYGASSRPCREGWNRIRSAVQ